jgi:quercetin dioxygenase-like cupin family protein
MICKKPFEHYGERIVCGKTCLWDYFSKQRLGSNNPSWISEEDIEKSTCIRCNKKFTYSRNGLHKEQKRKFCSLACSRGFNLKSLPFQSYRRKADYPREFRKLKIEIKKRDKCCQLCKNVKGLEIHHINYDKKDCDPDNLIALCKRCHTLTHYQRGFWEQLFTGLSSNSKIVPKGWGLEIHIVNHDKYCLKYLVFFKGKRFSLHEHNIKQELWLCNWGKFEAYIEDTKGAKDYFIFKQGDKLEILPSVKHQLQAITNSIITEVSTQDFPEDSIRTEKGD